MTHNEVESWWRHQIEIFSALLAICAGNSPVPREFPAQRPVTWSFDVFFDRHPNKGLSKQWRGWWFETLSCPLWRGRDVITQDNDNCTLRWRHNDHDSASNHQPHGCLLSRLFRRRSKKTSKLRVTGLCVGNSPGTGELPAQMACYAENVSIWWRHHEYLFDFVIPKQISESHYKQIYESHYTPIFI